MSFSIMATGMDYESPYKSDSPFTKKKENPSERKKRN